MRKALLLVDRGSREPEVFEELQKLCDLVRKRADYFYASYCFLEVLPPYIPEGIRRCIDSGAEFVTLMPYFLYPGMKLKDAVKKSADIMHKRKIPMVITKPLSYHPFIVKLIQMRIQEAKKTHNIELTDNECDVLLIGHGSSDYSARAAFAHAADTIRQRFRGLYQCSLELDTPSIAEGIERAIESEPKVLLMMPYFLHKGAHVKRDIITEVETALSKSNFSNAFITGHLGPDEIMAEIIIDRAKEVESRRIVG